MKNKNWFILQILAVLILIIFGAERSGGAAVPGRYMMELQYDSAGAVIPDPLRAEKQMRRVQISVAEFTDKRLVLNKKVIGWVKELDGSKVSVYPKGEPPVRVVAYGIGAYLKKAGYQVADNLVQWDLKEGSLPKGKSKVVIGGSIEEMEVSCWTGVFSNDYKTTLKLKLVIADAAKGKILYQGNVAIQTSRTDVSFSEGQLGQQAGAALAEAIEKIFEGKNVAEKMKEAFAR